MNNKHRAVKYKKLLQRDTPIKVILAENKDEALANVELYEPDLIIISTEFEDFDGYNLCKDIRKVNTITRPVIVLLSDKDEGSSARILGFSSGADDFLNTMIDDEEFSVRMFAHIRRHIEELSDQSSKLPGSTLINTNIKRRINLKKPWALMSITLGNLKAYKETYGVVAANQIVKAFIAILKANITPEDFIGHAGNEDFAVLTSPVNVEIIANNICKTFDTIAPKFYAPFEAERGFSIITDIDNASRKVSLVAIHTGIVSSETRTIENYQSAMSFANSMKDLLRKQLGSRWLLDRPMISGCDAKQEKKEKHYVLVVESDAALAYLLTTTLEMQGFTSDATCNKDEAIQLIDDYKPDLVLIDAVLPGDDGWAICEYIKTNASLAQTKIIMATVHHDKDKAFLAGADLYIPKPYEIISLHKWIDRLIRDRY